MYSDLDVGLVLNPKVKINITQCQTAILIKGNNFQIGPIYALIQKVNGINLFRLYLDSKNTILLKMRK